MTEYFENPRRLPKNIDGPFYTTGHLDIDSVWCGDCLWCEAPEAEAPTLLAPLTDDNTDTYFVAQPRTHEEVMQACMALRVCCTSALRYGGRDREIIHQLQNDPELCDYILNSDGSLTQTLDSQGQLMPFAREIVAQKNRNIQEKYRKTRQDNR